MSNLQDAVQDIVKKTSLLQDSLTRTEIVEEINRILTSPKFKAMSALDVCVVLIDKIKEGAENVKKG